MMRGAVVIGAAAAAVLSLAAQEIPPPSGMPLLDPLGEQEIRSVARVLQEAGHLTKTRRLAQLELLEPDKATVLAPAAPAGPRAALATLHDRDTGRTYEATVDIVGARVLSIAERRGVQPALYIDDFFEADRLVRGDHRWRAAIARRGIANAADLQLEAVPLADGRTTLNRLVRVVGFVRGASANPYARPLSGLVATVDLTAKKVDAVVDRDDVAAPMPDRDLMAGAVRPPPRDAPARDASRSFVRTGNAVRWGPWRFHYAVHLREGVVVSRVEYDGGTGPRSVLYRGSIAETLVIYAEAGPGWAYQSVFDEGEYGLGNGMVSLVPGGDVPESAELIDAFVADSAGVPRRLARAVGLYERDGGLAWRHTDYLTGRALTQRRQQLVLASVVTAANYDYSVNWIFDTDGSIELEILLSGILQVQTIRAAHDVEHAPIGHGVAAGLSGVHHQHFFSIRLDVDVDGPSCNGLIEVEAAPPGRASAASQALSITNRTIKTEGPLTSNSAGGRRWRIVNWSVRNALGEPAGYTLLPGEGSVPQTRPDASIRKRARFLDAPLWVTPFDDRQRYPAGRFVNQAAADDLVTWTQNARSVEGQDLVLWHTIGLTHLPRPEEWPVMPVYRAGLKLAPSGFMAGQPTTSVKCPRD